MGVWLTIVAGGILTYATRLSMIVSYGRVTLPAPLRRALRFIPPAALFAIILPEVFRPDGRFDLTLANPRPIAAALATLVAWRTKSVYLTIAVGMAAFWLLRAVV